MNKNIAVYPGSFDPITKGHLDIIERALPFFSELHIVVSKHHAKKNLFNTNERVEIIEETVQQEGFLNLENVAKIKVTQFDGLLVDYAKKIKANAIIRGLRAVSDFDYEFQMATMNRTLDPDIETIFFTTRGKYFYISSSSIKDIALHNGCISEFVPKNVEKYLKEKFAKN